MRTTLIVLAALVLHTTPLAAQGWLEPRPGPAQPSLVKLRSVVTVDVSDRVATVEVEEWFRNDGRGVAETDYLYPLPGESGFAGFSLFAGDDELTGETMDAAQARRIYEEIVRSRRDPALIELFGHGLLRARVFPIEPGETRRIRLRYTQLLESAGDALHFRYALPAPHRAPVAIAPPPRPLPGPPPQPGILRPPVQPWDDDRVTAGDAPAADVRTSLTLTVRDGAAIAGAYSPTHELDTRREAGRLVVAPRGELQGALSIFLTRAGRPVGLTLAAHRPNASEDGWFMLTLSPGELAAARVPRDVTAVVDVSGSMSGEKMEQARQALVQLLATLDARDRFRLISFSSGVSLWRDEWSAATSTALRDARAWIAELRAAGGTNISGALEEALRAGTPPERLPVVVFLTDGMPTVGETNIDRLLEGVERRRGRARVFSFGVGYDVNTRLLDALGAAGGGTTQYVEPDEDVERAVALLAARISHPVLADLEIAGAPVRIGELYPTRLPDLFAGEELIVFGRYAPRGDGAGQLVVTGRRHTEGGAVRAERMAASVHFPAHESGNEWIARLWATRKIGELERRLRIGGPDDEIIEEIRATALRHGLVSRYTSHLVLEPGAAGRLPFTVGRGGDPAAAPAIMLRTSGAAAVQAAEQSRVAREARTLTDVDALMRDAPSAAAGERALAGRIFRLRDDVWYDAALDPDADIVWVPAFGTTWLRLLEALPELREIAAGLDAVVVAGAGTAIGLREGQGSELDDAALARLVAAFRGGGR
jgi:Ca-activated chloride channel homolog